MYETLIVIGNLGRDPEMRYTPSGQAVTSFSIAVNRQYAAANGQQVKETKWFRISAWGKLAETCNTYLHKGSKVLVEGRLQADPNTGGPRVWEKDGRHGASFEVTASTVRFLSPKGEGDADANATEGSEAMQSEEIPF